MIRIRRCLSGLGLFRLSPEYTSCFALLTKDSPKSTHGHFRHVHLIWVCSFNSGYLLLLFRPIYLFYVAVGGKNYNQKACSCLILFSCSCINKQMIQSFTCIFKILFNYEWSGGGTAGFCLERQLSLCIRSLSNFHETSQRILRYGNSFPSNLSEVLLAHPSQWLANFCEVCKCMQILTSWEAV